MYWKLRLPLHFFSDFWVSYWLNFELNLMLKLLVVVSGAVARVESLSKVLKVSWIVWDTGTAQNENLKAMDESFCLNYVCVVDIRHLRHFPFSVGDLNKKVGAQNAFKQGRKIRFPNLCRTDLIISWLANQGKKLIHVPVKTAIKMSNLCHRELKKQSFLACVNPTLPASSEPSRCPCPLRWREGSRGHRTPGRTPPPTAKLQTSEAPSSRSLNKVLKIKSQKPLKVFENESSIERMQVWSQLIKPVSLLFLPLLFSWQFLSPLSFGVKSVALINPFALLLPASSSHQKCISCRGVFWLTQTCAHRWVHSPWSNTIWAFPKPWVMGVWICLFPRICVVVCYCSPMINSYVHTDDWLAN